MDSFPSLPLDSKLEISKLIEFSKSLIFKNQRLADEAETLISSKNAFNLMNAVIAAPPYDGSVDGALEIRMQELLNSIDESGLTLEQAAELRKQASNEIAEQSISQETPEIPVRLATNTALMQSAEHARMQVILSYAETNKYYIDYLTSIGYDIHRVVENKDGSITVKTDQLKYIDEVIKARTVTDHDILYYKNNILSAKFTKLFIQKYRENLEVYNICMHSEGFAKYKKYWNYVNFIVTFMTIEQMITAKLELVHDIDAFSERDIRNAFASFGLDFFSIIPQRYRLRLLKKLNSMAEGQGILQNKGTTRAIINLVNLFGFDNISIFKYYLIKDFERGEDGSVPLGERLIPRLSFTEIPYDETNLEKAILDTSNKKLSYNKVTLVDPYWGIEHDEAASFDFNIINTKYFGLSIALDLTKYSTMNAYFFHFLQQFEVENKLAQDLYVVNSSMSTKPIRLIDMLIGLYIVNMWLAGYEDVVPSDDPSAVESLVNSRAYNFNPYDNDLWDVKLSYDDNINRIRGYIMRGVNLDRFITIMNRDPGKNALHSALDAVDGIDNVSAASMLAMFKSNVDYMEKFRQILYLENDWEKYKFLRAKYESKFFAEMNGRFFNDPQTVQTGDTVEVNKYSTYAELLEARCPEFMEWINLNRENDDLLQTAFFEIIVTIENFLDNTAIDLTVVDYLNYKQESAGGNPSTVNYATYEAINFNLNPLAFSIISRYIKYLINVFKAYTVQLRELSRYYIYRDPLFESVKPRDVIFIHGHLWFDEYKDIRDDDHIYNLDYNNVDRDWVNSSTVENPLAAEYLVLSPWNDFVEVDSLHPAKFTGIYTYRGLIWDDHYITTKLYVRDEWIGDRWTDSEQSVLNNRPYDYQLDKIDPYEGSDPLVESFTVNLKSIPVRPARYTELHEVHNFQRDVSLVHRRTDVERVAAALLASWNSYDLDLDGSVTEAELAAETVFTTAATILSTFSDIDTNGDNLLSFEEVSTALSLSQEEFDALDSIPKKGYLTRSHLQSILFYILEDEIPSYRNNTIELEEAKRVAAMFPPRCRSFRESFFAHQRITARGQHERDSHTAGLDLVSGAGFQALVDLILGLDTHGIDPLTHNYLLLLKEELIKLHIHLELADLVPIGVIGSNRLFIHNDITLKSHLHFRDYISLTYIDRDE